MFRFDLLTIAFFSLHLPNHYDAFVLKTLSTSFVRRPIQNASTTKLNVVSGGPIPIPSYKEQKSGNDMSSDVVPDPLEVHLHSLARKFKLQLWDWEERTQWGFESKDNEYGIEVIHADIKIQPSLGIELMEMASGTDGQGLVLISGVSGNAATAATQDNEVKSLQVGDTIVGVSVPGSTFNEKTLAFDYDNTMDVLRRAKSIGMDTIHLELNRLVKRAPIEVKLIDGKTQKEVASVSALAGENLRQLLMRKGFKLYDSKTKRFDMPHATGDCSGDGLCGTCLVKVLQQMGDSSSILNPPSDMEQLLLKGRPSSWRAACRTNIGYKNQPGTLTIELHPQSNHQDELDPGVRDIHL